MAVHTVLEVLIVRVDVVENSVCVCLMACCKDNHLELFICLLQALHKVRPQIDARADGLLPWKVNFEDHVGVLGVDVVDTVHKCLVHVENQ